MHKTHQGAHRQACLGLAQNTGNADLWLYGTSTCVLALLASPNRKLMTGVETCCRRPPAGAAKSRDRTLVCHRPTYLHHNGCKHAVAMTQIMPYVTVWHGCIRQCMLTTCLRKLRLWVLADLEIFVQSKTGLHLRPSHMVICQEGPPIRTS